MESTKRFHQFRRSKYLVGFAIFLAFATDCATVTLVQTLAPALIKENNYDRFYPTKNNRQRTSGTSGTGLNTSVEHILDTNGTNSIIFEFCDRKNSRCVHFRAAAALESVLNDTSAEAYLRVIYCRRDNSSQCLQEKDVMQAIAPPVGYLNGVGPFAELLVNPVVGLVCSRFGHRGPFLFGSLLQVAGSLMFLLAPNTTLLFVARVTCGVASTLCEISCFMLVTHAFTDVDERARFMMIALSSSFPVGSMLSYLVGNTGFSLLGPRLPFGILFGMGLVDAVLRFFISTDSDTPDPATAKMDNKANSETSTAKTENKANTEISTAKTKNEANTETLTAKTGNRSKCEPSLKSPLVPKRRKGTYLGYFTNCYFVLTILMTFFIAFAFATVLSTAPNWATNVLHAQQWQLGVVLGISSTTHLISNIACGMVVTKSRTWVFLFASFICTSLGLGIYPITSNVWSTVAPEILMRVGFGIILGTASNLISIITELLFDGETAKAYSLFVASYLMGFTFGPLLGGVLLRHISFMQLYYSIGVVVFISSFGSFYQRTLG